MLIFYSMSLNVYFLLRIPLVCYLTNLDLGMSKRQLMDKCTELSYYIREVDWNSMYHYCGAVFRKAVCPVLHLRALVHSLWHKAGICVEKDGCSFTILVFIKKIPSQCYVEALVYVFLWNLLQWVCNYIFTNYP